jgi:hypothetical protein
VLDERWKGSTIRLSPVGDEEQSEINGRHLRYR